MSRTSGLTFDRWDSLATRILLMVILAGVIASALLVPLYEWATGEPLTWVLTTAYVEPLEVSAMAPRDGADLSWRGDALATVADAGAGTWLATLLPGLLLSTATAIVVLMMLRLLGRIQAGAPFSRASVISLRVVGLVLMVTPLLHGLAEGVANASVLDAAGDLTEPAQFSISLGSAVIVSAAGLVCAALAEAFARGTAMAEDVEGLV